MAKSKLHIPPEAIAAVMEAQRLLHDAASEFGYAEECGLDCQEFRRLHKEYSDRAEAIIRNYGPGTTSFVQ